jgi:PAS domain S-box-containing protein
VRKQRPDRNVAKKAFTEDEARFRTLFENSADAQFLSEEGGVLIDCNKAALQMMSCSQKTDILGHHVAEFSPQRQLDGQVSLDEAKDMLATAMAKGSHRFEWVHRRRDGTDFLAEVSLTALSVNGKFLVHGVLRDVTDWERLQRALRASERRYRNLFQEVTDGFAVVDMDGRFVEANPAYLDMLGYSLEELLKLSYKDVTPEKGHGMEDAMVDQVLARGNPDPYQKEYVRKDGQVIPIKLRAHLFRDEDGRPVEMWAFVRDITDRQKVEETRRKSKERFRLTFDQSPIGAAMADPLNFHWVRANKAFCRLLGYSEKELTQFTYVDVTHPDDAASTSELARRLVAGEVNGFEVEKRYIRKDRSVVWAHTFVQAVKDGTGRVLYLLGMIQDITERKKTEQSLKESEERYRTAIEYSNDGVVVTQEGKHVYVNRRFMEMFGYSGLEEILNKSIADAPHMHPDDVKRIVEWNRQRLHGVAVPSSYEHKAVHKDGRTLYVELSSARIMYDGKVASLSYMRDITKRKQAEEALRESEASFKQLFNSVNDGISLRDARTFELMDANRRFCEMYGYTLEELRRLPLGGLGEGESIDDRRKRLTAHYAQVAKGASSLLELENKGKDGTVYWTELNVTRITIGTRECLLSVVRDITERKMAEKALRRSEEAALLLARETGVIAEIGRIISSSLDIEEVYGRFAEEVRNLIPFDRILLNVVNQQEGTLTTAYVAGMEMMGRKKGATFPIAETVTEEMMRTGALALFHPESVDEVHSRYPGLVPAFQAGLRSRLSVLLVARGEVIGSLALWSKQPKAYGERDVRLTQSVASQIAGAIASAQLFRERKRAEDELQKEREKCFTILENDPTGVALIGNDGAYQYLNPEFTNITGYTLQDVPTGKEWFEKAYPDPHYRQKVIDTWKMDWLSRGRGSNLTGFTVTCKDGRKKEVEFRTTFLKDCTVIVLNDVTDRKRAEEKIRASLREKEVLLKEIHHRVKNNLQIVSSLLYLQARRTEHSGAISALRESRNRIKSMALIHEKLYQSPDLASVDMGEYTRSLVSDLQHSHIAEDTAVRLTVTIEDIPLGITEAIPCGLIINELVSNALKHAFPKGRAGEIVIQLLRRDAGQITLTVSDNGAGLPEQVDFRKSPSLGLTLINSLVEQLNGTIELDRRGGTTFTIAFRQSGEPATPSFP